MSELDRVLLSYMTLPSGPVILVYMTSSTMGFVTSSVVFPFEVGLLFGEEPFESGSFLLADFGRIGFGLKIRPRDGSVWNTLGLVIPDRGDFTAFRPTFGNLNVSVERWDMGLTAGCMGERGLVGVSPPCVDGDFRRLGRVDANWNFFVGVNALPNVEGEESVVAAPIVVFCKTKSCG